MSIRDLVLVGGYFVVAGVACSAGGSEASSSTVSAIGSADEGGTHANAPAPFDVLLQSGAGITPLAITEDDYVIYQLGQTVFVTSLRPGAPAVSLATLPESNTIGAYAFTSGKVAFIWTNPDPSQPGLGVSPLLIWTAAHGARAASSNSPLGTSTCASSADGEEVIFPSNASDSAGTQGDLVLASTDLSQQKTLFSNVPMLFDSGPCNPEAAFLGLGSEEYLAVEHCVGAATTATLSTFRDGIESDVENIVPGLTLFAGDRGRALTTTQVTSSTTQVPIVVTESGVTTVDPSVLSSFSFFAGDGSVLYNVKASPTATAFGLNREVFQHGSLGAPETIVPQQGGIYGIGVGSTAVTLPPTSPDGRWLAYGKNYDPTTQLFDLAVTNIEDGTTVTIDPVVEVNTNFAYCIEPVPFTSDSRYILYLKDLDDANPALVQGPLVATRIADQTTIVLSDDSPDQWLAAQGSIVVVGDNFVGPNVDLRIWDLESGATPRLVATGANYEFYLNRAKTALVYASNTPGSAGLRVTSVF